MISFPMITLRCHSCQNVFRFAPEGDVRCPHCQVVNHYSLLQKQFSPWEASFRQHPLDSFIATLKQVLFSPALFFKNLGVSSRFLPVVLFGIIAQTIGALATFGYQALFSLMQPAFFGALFKTVPVEDLLSGLMMPALFGLFVVITPIASFVGIIFSTALNHFILWILRGTNGGMQTTLHAVCYSMGAQIALIIPILGGIVGGIWQIVLLVIGLKELHGISYAKSICTVIIPFCICGMAVVFVVGLILALVVPAVLKSGAENLPWLLQLASI